MKTVLSDVLNFFFPVYCPVCGNILHLNRQLICLSCEMQMPRAGFRDPVDNPVARLFWGRARVEAAVSLFRFEKGSKYQNLLHELKYRRNKNIGIFLGKMLGSELKNTVFSTCDLIIPVPLHPRKQRKRGFNQSELIAQGISQMTGIPVKTDILQREINTSTQTLKGRFERSVNVEKAFRVIVKQIDQHVQSVLLIDDVVTTGSTLEACTNIIHNVSDMKVYIATIACA